MKNLLNFGQWNNYECFNSRRDIANKAIEKILKKEISQDQTNNVDSSHSEYLDSLKLDAQNIINYFNSNLSYTSQGIKPTIPINLSITYDLTFKASVSQSIDLKECNVDLSLGLLITLDDIMNRVCCNSSFFSIDASNDQQIWQGTQCLWPKFNTAPKIRFYDYNQFEVESKDFSSGSTLGKYLSGIPFGDKERMYIADLMFFIALNWIIFHEDSHYWLGHLHFDMANNVTGNRSLDEIDIKIDKDPNEIFKILEWQADRFAILDLVGLMLNNTGSLAFDLPSTYRSQPWPFWHLRIILVAVGTVIIAMQKVKLIRGKSNFYPSHNTRFITVLNVFLEKTARFYRQNGSFLGITKREDFYNNLCSVIYWSINDLVTVEEVITNSVDYQNDLYGVILEPNTPESLNFLLTKNYHPDEIQNNIKEIVAGLLSGKASSNNSIIDEKWFSEFRQIVNQHKILYDNTLPKYRNMASLSGRSPFF